MKSLGKTLSVSMVTAMLLGIILLMRTPSAAHANTLPQVSPQGTSNWQRIVTQANPYVHVVNGSATIDSQINQALSQSDVALVKQAVAKFNSLPSTLRSHSQISGTSTIKEAQSNASQLAFQWTVSVYWWGVRLWINTYAAQAFGVFMAAAGTAIGAVIGEAIGAAAGLVIGSIIGAAAGGQASIFDYACGNQGVFIDIPWYFPAAHLTSVC